MSLPSDATHINPGAVAQGRTVPGQAPAIPFHTRLSMIRQRILLQVRWWFRLPIDDIKDQQISNLLELNQKQLETIQTLAGILQRLQGRVQHFEHNIPRMRVLGREYDAEQQRLRSVAAGPMKEAELRMAAGLLPIRR